jgi:hypothetical protein
LLTSFGLRTWTFAIALFFFVVNYLTSIHQMLSASQKWSLCSTLYSSPGIKLWIAGAHFKSDNTIPSLLTLILHFDLCTEECEQCCRRYGGIDASIFKV